MPDPNPNDKAPAPPAAPTVEELLAGNATAEGRARTAALFGIRNEEVVGPEIIDVTDGPEVKAGLEALTRDFGGEAGFREARADLSEAVELFDPEREMEKAVAGMSVADESAAIREAVASYREVLASPERAQAALQAIYAHPMREPGLSYFSGRGSAALNDAIARLWAATTGEEVVRPKPRGDGYSY